MYHLWDSRVENELRTIIRGCDRVSLLSLSGQLIPGGIQQVCSVLKNHKSHPRNFPSLQNPFSSSLFGSSSPPFFCRRTIVTTHVFCFSSFFSFSSAHFLWRERSFCHIINSNSVSVLFCLSLKWKQWQNCHECVPRKTLEPAALNYGGAIWDVFLETLQELGGERLQFLCDPAHYKPFLFPTSFWTYSISTAL